ncbi:MAG TPA: hypothetical protein ENJ09_06260, partial [Planctomycetes bacterium]|nr:hypothetical protein [Planctomycetota bacterium]
MRSVIVLGCRAAGTSMVARLLAPAGYRVDDGGAPPSLDAPFGRFELVEMRRLEDALLNPRIEAGSTCRAPGIPRFARDGRERKPWRFAPHLREHARRFLEAGPVVLRDERLAFTLDAWRGLAPEARIVCIFRSPERVARSLARKLGLSIDSALSEWTATYRAVLELANRGCEILFLEADQLFEPETRARLASVLETTLDANALDPALRPEGGVGIDVEVPEETSEIHRVLLDRADFVPRERAPNAPRDVAALIPIVDRDLAACGPAGIGELLLDLRRDLALSRGARVRPVWIDATSEGLDRFPPRGSGHGL